MTVTIRSVRSLVFERVEARGVVGVAGVVGVERGDGVDGLKRSVGRLEGALCLDETFERDGRLDWAMTDRVERLDCGTTDRVDRLGCGAADCVGRLDRGLIDLAEPALLLREAELRTRCMGDGALCRLGDGDDGLGLLL